jgi:hypothetical protein
MEQLVGANPAKTAASDCITNLVAKVVDHHPQGV